MTPEQEAYAQGFAEGHEVFSVLKAIWVGGALQSCCSRWPQLTTAFTLTPMGGESKPVPETIAIILRDKKLIERCAKQPWRKRYDEWRLTDDGLKVLGLPTIKQQRSVEVLGVDTRRPRKGRKVPA